MVGLYENSKLTLGKNEMFMNGHLVFMRLCLSQDNESSSLACQVEVMAMRKFCRSESSNES